MRLHEIMWPSLLACVVFPTMSAAETVVRVKDGDSLVVDSNGREVEVRLADIDTPEFNQPRGEEARDALKSLVDGKEVRLELVGGDAYRRIVAHVFVGDLDVNAELVRLGLAWVRRAYDPAPSLVALEDGARQAGRGLWADEDPVPPWIWRKTEQSTDRQLGAIPEVECGTKQSCAKMTSCEEAIAFLRQCKLTRIDGDGDGIPCEKLCRYYR
ncbi:MAG: nuclease [Gammaproteobacteria bacterium]|nr:nuclease [Gammaproteobacteria bacterium]MYK47101.1 nuclease [Gammaproteobacteria bacterium]